MSNGVEGVHGRSKIVAILTATDEIKHLTRAADFRITSLQRKQWRFLAKSLLKRDRLQSLHQNGYSERPLFKWEQLTACQIMTLSFLCVKTETIHLMTSNGLHIALPMAFSRIFLMVPS